MKFMKQHELDDIVQQANECHRKTVANKDSWLVVEQDKEEAALRLIDALDCRSDEGVTVGLIDAIITLGKVLADRDFTPPAVVEALKDLADDEDVKIIMDAANSVTENQ